MDSEPGAWEISGTGAARVCIDRIWFAQRVFFDLNFSNFRVLGQNLPIYHKMLSIFLLVNHSTNSELRTAKYTKKRTMRQL